MLKRVACLCCIMLVLVPFSIGCAETSTLVNYRCVGGSWPATKAFLAAHPEIKLQNVPVENYVYTTSELAGKLLTGELRSDVFLIETNLFDDRVLFEKGYFLDLSSSEIIVDAVNRMHPVIREAAMLNGKVYGFPYFIRFDFYYIDAESWERAGYEKAEIPQSYPAFLDFLEQWCDRIDEDPDIGFQFHVRGDWAGDWKPSCYTEWLTTCLMNDYFIQKQAAGEPLSFQDEELAALLDRTLAIGQRLYETEPPTDDETSFPSLVMNSLQMKWEHGDTFLSFRMNEQQPKAVPIYLEMLSVYAGTTIPDLAIELLEDVVQYGDDFMYDQYSSAYLYEDAQPTVSSSYDSEIQRYQRLITKKEQELQQEDLTPTDRKDLEDALQVCKDEMEAYENEGKYLVSQESIDSFAAFAQDMIILRPHAFSPGTTAGNVNYLTLLKRFAAGQLPADQFLKKLDKLAYMVQMEDE